MQKLQRTLDRFESAAQAAGFELVEASEFWRYFPDFYAENDPPMSARKRWADIETFIDRETAKRKIVIPEEYKVVLARWNGLSLYKNSFGGVPEVFHGHRLFSIEEAIKKIDSLSADAREIDLSYLDLSRSLILFGELDQIGLGYNFNPPGSTAIYDFSIQEGLMKMFPSLAALFECLADALEADVELCNLDSSEKINRSYEMFRRVCRRKCPWIDFWYSSEDEVY